jgi:peptide/nickel transport system ATP-binding protein
MLICDEPVSALDVSIQAQIINLLQDMKERYDLTMLFIAHDLSVVKVVCDRVAVMYLGRICELADSESLYRRPAHPYTAALLSAIPEADPSRPPQPIAMKEGELPSATAPPPGCRFHTRCPKAQAICTDVVPILGEIEDGHSVACHFPIPADA